MATERTHPPAPQAPSRHPVDLLARLVRQAGPYCAGQFPPRVHEGDRNPFAVLAELLEYLRVRAATAPVGRGGGPQLPDKRLSLLVSLVMADGGEWPELAARAEREGVTPALVAPARLRSLFGACWNWAEAAARSVAAGRGIPFRECDRALVQARRRADSLSRGSNFRYPRDESLESV